MLPFISYMLYLLTAEPDTQYLILQLQTLFRRYWTYGVPGGLGGENAQLLVSGL